MKKIIVLLLAAVVIGVLFFALKPKPQTSKSTQDIQDTISTSDIKSFPVEIKDGKLASGQDTLRVKQGDEVRIVVTSDMAGELHLHGYDKEVELAAGIPSTVDLTATMTGRFEAELHETDETIFVLEVQPNL